MSRLTSLIEQTMGSIRAVQVFGREGMEQQRFEGTSLNFVEAQLKFRFSEQVLNVATVAITGLGTAAVLFFAADRVISGALTVGSVWVFVSYMQSLYQMMNEIMFVYGPFQDAVVGVGRAFQVLDQTPDIKESPNAIAKDAFEDAVRFRDVRIEYESGRRVLRGVNFEVRKGEKVAIVGETGSGKTTILNLLPRLYDVTSGSVEIDGIDVRELKIASLRDLISMVPQEPLLFSATVRENILYGRLDATPEDVEAAAVAARAHGFIQELSAKYETEVGRARRQALGRAAAANFDCARVLERRAHPAAGRTDFSAGPADRGGLPGRPRGPHGRSHGVHRGPPPVHDQKRRPHILPRGRNNRGTRTARGANGNARPLLRAVHAAVRLRRD